MKYLFLLNHPPYGTEHSYNAVRLAKSLLKHEGVDIKFFLMADSVLNAKAKQTTPNGYYNLERMLKSLIKNDVTVGACGACLDARGLSIDDLVEGVHRSSMDELAQWTMDADKVVVY